LGLDSRRKAWLEEMINKSRTSIIEDIASRGIDYQDLASYAETFENEKYQDLTDDEKTALKAKQDSFQNKYCIEQNDPFLLSLVARNNWISNIQNTDDLDEYFIKSATVVAGTCSGFSFNTHIREMQFDFAIIDEAAKAIYPEILLPIINAKKVILVGDHMQLSPILDQDVLNAAKSEFENEKYCNNPFEWLYNILPDTSKEILSTQYRMNPTIGTMISNVFYRHAIQNGKKREDRELHGEYWDHKAIIWINTSHAKGIQHEDVRLKEDGSITYYNKFEASNVHRLISLIDGHVCADDKYNIGVITPYSAQVKDISTRIEQMQLKNIKVDINTVDAFQGSQRDIIVYSVVRSNFDKKIGFLDDIARLNVSLSRAKRMLIIVGDLDFLNDTTIHGNSFPEIISYILNEPLYCGICCMGAICDEN
jgi:superfamily I DNA and/or RNA helicase